MPNSRAPKSRPSATEVEFRRAPKLLPFAITGAVIGLIAAVLLYLVIPVANRSSENIFGLLLISVGSAGLGLGVLAAILIDLITAKRVKKVLAERLSGSEGQL